MKMEIKTTPMTIEESERHLNDLMDQAGLSEFVRQFKVLTQGLKLAVIAKQEDAPAVQVLRGVTGRLRKLVNETDAHLTELEAAFPAVELPKGD